jgi:hypothetical protein
MNAASYHSLFFFISCILSSMVGPFPNLFGKGSSEILREAQDLLETSGISYAYGGSRRGNDAQCAACNLCLGRQKLIPPKRQLAVCPDCKKCSLDCSHFINLVYKRAHLAFPYLDSASMARFSARRLLRSHKLVDLGRQARRAAAGDILVYNGHVVLLEKIHKLFPKVTADIIHSTSGKDLRGPGLGIQRQRLVYIEEFKGPLLKILRHKSLLASMFKAIEQGEMRDQP